MTMSDGITGRPDWIGYSTKNGMMRSNLLEEVDSGYYNFKITATDPYGGSYSYYKSMLVDTTPIAHQQYVIVYCSVQTACAHDLSTYFSDPNPHDVLTYSLPLGAATVALLQMNGLAFSTSTQILQGKPPVVTTISQI